MKRLCTLVLFLPLHAWGGGDFLKVSGKVVLVPAGRDIAAGADFSNAVVWLEPVKPLDRDPRLPPRRFEIRQQHKRFDPHVLPVPAGSVVSFPNLDPFFHNVFSMFDGTRFDLGLYEAGASHSVTFQRSGICYIFCNIHPEMSAVVIVLDSPFFAVTNQSGAFSIDSVPPGPYRLLAWHERAKSENTQPREVSIAADSALLEPIRLIVGSQLMPPHKNKYGRDYDPSGAPAPYSK